MLAGGGIAGISAALARVIDARDEVIQGLYTGGETQGEIFYNNVPRHGVGIARLCLWPDCGT